MNQLDSFPRALVSQLLITKSMRMNRGRYFLMGKRSAVEKLVNFLGCMLKNRIKGACVQLKQNVGIEIFMALMTRCCCKRRIYIYVSSILSYGICVI